MFDACAFHACVHVCVCVFLQLRFAACPPFLFVRFCSQCKMPRVNNAGCRSLYRMLHVFLPNSDMAPETPPMRPEGQARTSTGARAAASQASAMAAEAATQATAMAAEAAALTHDANQTEQIEAWLAEAEPSGQEELEEWLAVARQVKGHEPKGKLGKKGKSEAKLAKGKGTLLLAKGNGKPPSPKGGEYQHRLLH